MSKLESVSRLLRRWFTSIPFFILLGLVLGGLVAVPLMPKPKVATINISGVISNQDFVDNILNLLQSAREERSIKAVVLRINSPGGSVSAVEQIYMDVLRLKQRKPVVVSIGQIAASGGYYIAVAGDYVYAEPTSLIGSIGAFVGLPEPEELDETFGTTGPFKATGGSRQRFISILEMVRQQFVSIVMSQRGERLKLSEQEISRAELFVGLEGINSGLVDEMGTRAVAIEKAANLAGLRNYDVVELRGENLPLSLFFGSADFANLKAQTGLFPRYYYLYFESE
ncbi:MAG: S49 family peptidase [Chloroflexi bacterium]|nr:S49 family peptidase [Chloroflexota bacterium]